MDGLSIIFERPAQSFRNYGSLTNTIVLDEPETGTGGTTAPASIPHGGGVATWGDLPAAGSFTTETRQVADLAGNSEGRTGSGSARWDGLRWIPQGGVLPAGGGPGLHCVMTITATTIDPVFDISTSRPFYTHSGDTTLSLGADAAAFAAEVDTDILRNGISVKLHVQWQSPTTFLYNGRADTIDTFEVRTP